MSGRLQRPRHLDATHSTPRRRRRALLAGLAAAVVAVLGPAPSALADGDPASDVLPSQSLFLPQDAGLTPVEQVRLDVLLAAARSQGYPLHVAVIAGRGDMGSIGALWQRPGPYAVFLGQEISLLVHGPLLVVMPGGYGYSDPAGSGTGALPAALSPLAAPGRALGPATIAAVRRLAAAAGHPLGVTQSRTTPGGGSSAAGALPLIVFVAGWAAIAAAWGVSLRRRPLRSPAS